jgi:hypothetical protein
MQFFNKMQLPCQMDKGSDLPRRAQEDRRNAVNAFGGLSGYFRQPIIPNNPISQYMPHIWKHARASGFGRRNASPGGQGTEDLVKQDF